MATVATESPTVTLKVNNMKEIYMSWEEFERAIHVLANEIKKSGLHFSTIYGIPRGGLMVALRLSHLLNIQLITVTHIRDDTLIVDDIIDSGKSMVRSAHTASLVYNPKSIYKPKFYAVEKLDDRWIVFPWEKSL